jgi:MFS family permease
VVIGAVLMGCSELSDYSVLLLGRFVIGISAGFSAGLAPMYVSEISPASLRGALGTFYQLVITMSILMSQVGFLISLPIARVTVVQYTKALTFRAFFKRKSSI